MRPDAAAVADSRRRPRLIFRRVTVAVACALVAAVSTTATAAAVAADASGVRLTTITTSVSTAPYVGPEGPDLSEVAAAHVALADALAAPRSGGADDGAPPPPPLVARLRAALRAVPDYRFGLLTLAEAAQRGAPAAEAVAAYDAAAAAAAAAGDDGSLGLARYNAGLLLLAEGARGDAEVRLDAAWRALSPHARASPHLMSLAVGAAVALAQARAQRGDSGAALAAVDAGLALAPDSPRLLLERAVVEFGAASAGGGGGGGGGVAAATLRRAAALAAAQGDADTAALAARHLAIVDAPTPAAVVGGDNHSGSDGDAPLLPQSVEAEAALRALLRNAMVFAGGGGGSGGDERAVASAGFSLAAAVGDLSVFALLGQARGGVWWAHLARAEDAAVTIMGVCAAVLLQPTPSPPAVPSAHGFDGVDAIAAPPPRSRALRALATACRRSAGTWLPFVQSYFGCATAPWSPGLNAAVTALRGVRFGDAAPAPAAVLPPAVHSRPPAPRAPRARALRLAIGGYDMRSHATGFLLEGVTRHADRARLSVSVYQFGPVDPGTPVRLPGPGAGCVCVAGRDGAPCEPLAGPLAITLTGERCAAGAAVRAAAAVAAATVDAGADAGAGSAAAVSSLVARDAARHGDADAPASPPPQWSWPAELAATALGIGATQSERYTAEADAFFAVPAAVPHAAVIAHARGARDGCPTVSPAAESDADAVYAAAPSDTDARSFPACSWVTAERRRGSSGGPAEGAADSSRGDGSVAGSGGGAAMRVLPAVATRRDDDRMLDDGVLSLGRWRVRVAPPASAARSAAKVTNAPPVAAASATAARTSAHVSAPPLDIFVDPMANTFGHREAVVAGRPAPVVVSHMVAATSGLRAVDWFIADAVKAPPDGFAAPLVLPEPTLALLAAAGAPYGGVGGGTGLAPLVVDAFSERLVLLPLSYSSNYYSCALPLLGLRRQRQRGDEGSATARGGEAGAAPLSPHAPLSPRPSLSDLQVAVAAVATALSAPPTSGNASGAAAVLAAAIARGRAELVPPRAAAGAPQPTGGGGAQPVRRVCGARVAPRWVAAIAPLRRAGALPATPPAVASRRGRLQRRAHRPVPAPTGFPPALAAPAAGRRLVCLAVAILEKLDPGLFSAWLNVLQRSPGAELWLLGAAPAPAAPGAAGGAGPPAATSAATAAFARLSAEAVARGLPPGRLRLLPRTGRDAYVGRVTAAADLVLDTRVYSGHTTTLDALWAGVPVVTLEGGTVPARVSSSHLQAAGGGLAPALVTRSFAEFEDAAAALLAAPRALAALRRRTLRAGPRCAHLNWALTTRNLERAYAAMWEARAAVPAAADPGGGGGNSAGGSVAQEPAASVPALRRALPRLPHIIVDPELRHVPCVDEAGVPSGGGGGSDSGGAGRAGDARGRVAVAVARRMEHDAAAAALLDELGYATAARVCRSRFAA